jgi:hypothetical protein
MNSGAKQKKMFKVKEVLPYAIASKTFSSLNTSGSVASPPINLSSSIIVSKNVTVGCSLENFPAEKELVCIESTIAVEPFKDTCVFNDMRTIFFHPDSRPLDKKLTLCFTEWSKDKVQVVGRERTFFLNQFDEAKIYETEVKFQKNFKALESATLNVKIQYVKNEEALINKIMNLFEKKRKLLGLLLKRWMNEIKTVHGEHTSPVQKHKRVRSQFGGWYDKNILPT